MPFFDVQNGQTTGDQSLWNQFTDAFTAQQDADVQLFAQLSPPAAPTVSVNTTAGNLTGNYQYALAFETGYWEGPVGSGTLYTKGNTGGGTASVTISPNGQQANISIPSAPKGVVNVPVYRTKANGSTFYYLTTVQANTSTQINDNALDSSLGAQMPTTNTTGGHFIGDGSKLTNLPFPTIQGGTGITATTSGNTETITLNPASTTVIGGVEVSAAPASGQNPVAVATTDANWSKLTGGTTSVADSEHTHQTFPDAVTFNGGATVPSGETLTVAGTETVTGILQASGSGVINATELGGNAPSYYAPISSPNFSGTPQVSGNNVMQALSGGYKVQSGKTAGGESTTTVTFPTAFDTTPIIVVSPASTTDETVQPWIVYDVTTTGFYVFMSSSYGDVSEWNWVAIGS